MAESTNYSILINKLDEFIRKYYLNNILRGSLICLSVCLGLFLIYTFSESQFFFSKGIRKTFFISYMIVMIASFGYFVFYPLMKYFRLGQRIPHEEAARIIGVHFSNVEDKLLNILELKKDAGQSGQRALIEASINQKAETIKIVPFRNAINLNANRRYLKYALPPLMLFLFLLFAAPSLIKDSTYRIINNNKDFVKAAPFRFELANKTFEVLEFEDYLVEIKVVGDVLPENVFLRTDNYEYRMQKVAPDVFTYLFPNVREDYEFEVFAGRYSGDTYRLKVLPRPKMIDFRLQVQYPRHIGRKNETLVNNGDITVPEGSRLEWKFNTSTTEELLMQFGSSEAVPAEAIGNAGYGFSKRIIRDESYKVILKNKNLTEGSILSFNIRSIKDEFPEISVESFQDSLESQLSYFVGSAQDDYGLTRLQFVYEKIGIDGSVGDKASEPITFAIGTFSDFEYIMDVQRFNLAPGEKVNYYFEIFDNDGVNGPKSAKSSVMTYKKKSLEEVKLEEEQNEEEIKDKLDSTLDEAREIQEELKKLRERLLQKEEPDWQDRKNLEKLLDRQKKLKEKLQEAKNAHEKNLKNQKEFMNLSPEMQEKQERLQELFEELVDDEMKDLMEQIQELMEELNKEQSLQMMEEFKKDEEALEKEMERLQELYKQLEVEKEINEAMEKLEELAEKLDELSEDAKKEESDQDELEQRQEEVNKEFEELQEKMEETIKKNEELEFSQPLSDDMPEQMDDIGEDLEEGEKDLKKGENQKASQSQKKASQKMKRMAQSMQSQMQMGQQEQMEEDLETLRQLLENLVTLSFGQENLISQINRTVINTPRYISLLQDQMRIKDDFKVVEDTLQALSKRQPKIESFVLKKVTEIKSNLGSSLEELEDRKKPEANQSQRTTMTNLNDLALMLSETMEQMQQQMSSMMAGSQMCSNPGKSQGQGNRGKVPADKISEGQEKMSEELQKMSEQSKSGKGNSAKDFANAAAQQAALRKALEEMQQQQQEEGGGLSDQLQKIIDEMDKQEIDLVNKKLDNEMLLRQQDILTRLLEADKAQKEREYDNERKSEESENIKRELPPSLQEYLKERKAQLDQFKYVSPELRPHYKRLVDEYYKKLKRA